MLLPMIQSKESPSLQTKVPIDFDDDEPSGPYIPISECYTGKPVCFKNYPNSNQNLPPPPPLPSCSSSTVHHQIPSHLHPSIGYKQLPTSPGVHHHHHPHHPPHSHQYHHPHHIPPSHHPSHHHQVTNYDVPRSSVFTKVALPINSSAITNLSSSTSTNSLNGRKTNKPQNLIVGPLSQTINRNNRVNHSNYRNEPPPRPPKPKKLNNRSKSESCSPAAHGPNHLIGNDHLSPSTSLNSHLDLHHHHHHHHHHVPSSPGQFNPNINSSSSNSLTNNNNNNKVNSPTTTTTTISQPLTLDDVYDFPKSEQPVSVFTSLRTAIPAPGNRSTKGNSHSYTNAPPGHLSKPPVFTYDYKGSLPVYLDDNTIAFDLDNCDRSPSTPNSAFDSLSSSGSLNKSLTPPAVNRDLKPKRRDSDSDNNISPTSPTFTLAPPPAHSKSYTNQFNSKPKTRHLNNGSMPRVPSRGRQFQHHITRDESNSDEDIINNSSIFHKRNASLDDQSRRAYTMPRKSPSDSPSVTYLDLDLKENSRGKDSCRQRSSNSSEKSLNYSKDLNGKSSLSGSQSTVYKSIDFVATDAFRQLRISSQRCVDRE